MLRANNRDVLLCRKLVVAWLNDYDRNSSYHSWITLKFHIVYARADIYKCQAFIALCHVSGNTYTIFKRYRRASHVLIYFNQFTHWRVCLYRKNSFRSTQNKLRIWDCGAVKCQNRNTLHFSSAWPGTGDDGFCSLWINAWQQIECMVKWRWHGRIM